MIKHNMKATELCKSDNSKDAMLAAQHGEAHASLIK